MSEELKDAVSTTHEDPSAGTKNTGNTEQDESKKQLDNRIPYERFKEKVDEVNELKRQLKALQKERDEAERKKLEEQQEYKKLAEKYRAELEEYKSKALNARKDFLLLQAGYSKEQAEVLRNTITGETDEEIADAIEKLKTVIPPKPKYVDPAPMNGEREKPGQTDEKEIGRKLIQALKAKGKIR